MADRNANKSNRVTRRTVLSGLATAGASSVVGIASAEPSGAEQFIGITYDPLTDKRQGDATATLNFSGKKVTGQIRAAGFTIPVGRETVVREQNNHPTVDTYVFEKTDDRFTVDRDGQTLGLHGRIDKIGGKLTGTLTRPSPEYGKIAFSFLRDQPGASVKAIASSLYPAGKRQQVSDHAAVTIPDTGIPTSNSINNAPPKPKVETDGGDVGFLDTKGEYGSIYDDLDSRCDSDAAYMAWDYSFGTSAEVRYDGSGQLYTDYDEISSGGGKRYQMESYFTDVPDPLVKSCDQEDGVPYQTDVEFKINHSGDSSANDFSFDIPRPDGENTTNDGGDGIVGLTLDIVNTVTGAWGGVGTAVLNYALSTDSESDVTVSKDNSYNSDGQLYNWELVLDGYNDAGNTPYFPDTSDNAAGVSIQVDNLSAPGKQHTLKSRSRFEFGHYRYIDGACPCASGFNTTFVTSQTGVFENNLTYDSIDA